MESSVKSKACAAIPTADVSAVSVEAPAPLFTAPSADVFPALSAVFPVPSVRLLSAPAAADTLLSSVPLPLSASAAAFSAVPLPAVSRMLPVTPSAPASEAPDRPASSPVSPSEISSCAASCQPSPAAAASSAFSPSESSSSSPVSSTCTEFSSWGFSAMGFVPS